MDRAYLDGRTDPDQVHRIERHLEHRRRCGLESRTYVEIKSALARQGEPVDPDTVQRLSTFGRALLRGDDEPEHPPTPGEGR